MFNYLTASSGFVLLLFVFSSFVIICYYTVMILKYSNDTELFLKKTLNYKGTYFWTQKSYKNFYYCIILFFVASSKQPFKIISTNTSLQRYFEQTEKLDLLNCCWWTLKKNSKVCNIYRFNFDFTTSICDST